jgi:hypothetical protein
MRFHVLRVFALVCGTVSLPAHSWAQESAPALTAQLRLAQQRNWLVRITTDTAPTLEGRVRAQGDDRFLVGNHAIALQYVRQVERRLNVGGGWKAGAFVGAGMGAAFGWGLGGLCESDCGGVRLTGAAIMTLPGALLGGVIGQLISPPQHRWQRVWP